MSASGAIVHESPLVITIALALGAALVFGFLARRLGISSIVGYLIAGMAVGPHTPGLVADVAVATDLAELGIALLMFGVGLHFSPADLARVRWIAIPGAVAQSLVATLLGVGVGFALGWGLGGGLVLGLAISVASTVVLLRGLMDCKALETPAGHVAIGWLIVEDLFTVVILVLLPALAGALGGTAASGSGGTWTLLGMTVLKVGALAAVVLVAGARIIPWFLDRVARLASRELFTLAVLAVALGIAVGTTMLTGVSMALGAFLAGMAVGQSELSHQAAADSIPLRDAFAVLFFVSVGMLVDPRLVFESPLLLLATLAIILVAKPLTALLLVVGLGHPVRMGLTVAFGLAQVGEFSFILVHLGRQLDLLPQAGHDAVLAGALVSIALNPLLLRAIDPIDAWVRRSGRLDRYLSRRVRAGVAASTTEGEALRDHVILCGSGRVGTVVRRMLERQRCPFVVIEQDRLRAARLEARGVPVLTGDSGNPLVLDHARVEAARLMVVSFVDPVTVRLAVDHARRANPALTVIVRVASRTERDALGAIPGVQAVMGEFESALEISRRVLVGRGMGSLEAQAIVMDMRRADAGRGGETNLVEVTVGVSSPLAGRSIASLALPPTARILVVRRGADELIAHGETVLDAGDVLVVLGAPDGMEALRTRMGGGRQAEAPGA